MALLQNFYETTLDALRDAKNDRLWFKTNTKLGKLYFDRNDFTKLQKILKQLHQSCQASVSVFNIFFAFLYFYVYYFFHFGNVYIWGRILDMKCW